MGHVSVQPTDAGADREHGAPFPQTVLSVGQPVEGQRIAIEAAPLWNICAQCPRGGQEDQS